MHLKRSFKSIAKFYFVKQSFALQNLRRRQCIAFGYIKKAIDCPQSKRYGQCIKNLRFLIDQSPTAIDALPDIAKGDVRQSIAPKAKDTGNARCCFQEKRPNSVKQGILTSYEAHAFKID